MTKFQDSNGSDVMVSILSRHKVLSCILKFNHDHQLYFCLISNDLFIPVSINFETREKLSSLEFCVDGIVKIIRLLDQNKAHGCD